MTSLADNIRLLGNLLGETIVAQAGNAVFDIEEQIRALSKARRTGDTGASEAIADLVAKLADDPGRTAEVVKAFSTWFYLVNLCEEHQRIEVLRQRQVEAHHQQRPPRESIGAAIRQLADEGISADQFRQTLDDMAIMPVFTAHPTESRRRTTRQVLRQLSGRLFEHRNPATPEFRHQRLVDEMRAAITLLWQSDDSRNRKPLVMDEVRNTGLFVFEQTLFDVVPEIYEALEEALAAVWPDQQWQVPPLLQFGSWIGGDRDGNPFVDCNVTEEAVRAQMDLALERYADDVLELYELLSPSLGRAGFDADFLRQLQAEIAAAPDNERETIDRFAEEPYRQKLILMHRRLVAARRLNGYSWDQRPSRGRAYASADQLLDDLRAIARSLTAHRGEVLVRGPLSRLIRRVEVFGFHLATLDIRQHSRRHEEALAEVLQHYRIADDYPQWNEPQRVAFLTKELEGRRPLTARLEFSAETRETVALFRLIRTAQQMAGTTSIRNYVVSMTDSESDLLEVLLLAADAGLFGQLNIVPLFETIDDLRAAPLIMERLFGNPAYRRHLDQLGSHQQVMIGYSDSNKDGGFLCANWMLFTAQRQLGETCRNHNIDLTLFHGRGGSIGRGGGPANRSILAQPPESIRGRIRITEQGEVVSSRYTHAEIAARHLHQLTHAVLCSLGRRPSYDRYPRWSAVMEELSQLAFASYRALVESPPFLEYFHLATPIDQIDRLNLGSRPARRKSTESINDLRAIPWVFAWTQSRANIPSWFGTGSALQQWIDDPVAKAQQERLALLQEMYREWPFFQSVLANVHAGLSRADMGIASLYAELAPSRAVFGEIAAEFERTRDYLLRVTGHAEVLDTEKWLQESIRLRNPYVDPLNFVQAELLRRWRAASDEPTREQLGDLIRQSVNGIAAGLQNIG